MPFKNTYTKAEKLKSDKAIARLFSLRKSYAAYPIRVFYATEKVEKGSVRVGVSCSKKYFKQAVMRNKAKRMMREAYRTQKHHLAEWAIDHNYQIDLFFLYSSKEPANYKEVETKIFIILQYLYQQFSTKL